MQIIACVVILILFKICLSANILSVTTLASPSHHIWHMPYLLALVKKGHNVTLLTHDEEEANEKVKNLTILTLEGVYEKIHEDYILEDLAYDTPLQSILNIFGWIEGICKYDLETDGLKTLLTYPKNYKFDLIVWDVYCGRCLYPLIDRFGTPPVIATSPFGLHPHFGFIFGNNIATHVPFYQVPFTNKMNFLERLLNFYYIHFLNFANKYWSLPRENKVAKKCFGDNVRSAEEFERNMSLLLVNVDPVLNYPESLPANIIPVGGIHIEPVKELPKDLKRILDEAKHGVILIIFGTNLNFINFGKVQQQAFIDVLKRLPQTILMKSDETDIKFPDNVIVNKWLPQNDILAHPNVRLFITHAGLLSSQQTIYHGVPVVGLPFYLDQHGNTRTFVAKKLGRSIVYLNMTSDSVYDAIKDVLDNPVYRKNMLKASKIFRDHPNTPLERALFWTEYLLRHGSAEHLSPATRDMPIFQRFDLDVSLVLLIISVIFVVIIYISVIRLCEAVFCRPKIDSKLKRI